MTFQPGTYTIAFASDDGGFVQLVGVNFSNEFNERGGIAGDDTAFFGTPRGFDHTGGTFTVNRQTEFELNALFFEAGAGDFFEISIASDAQADFSAANFELLQDGALGGLVAVSNIAAPEPSVYLLMLILGSFIYFRKNKTSSS